MTATDVSILCTEISTVMAVLQFVAAGVSLWAAWKIAADQKAEATRIKRAGRADFIAVVSSLAEEALYEAEKAEKALRAGAGPNGIIYNFGQRLADLHEALQPIRSGSPPDAKLMLAVGRLSRVLHVIDPAGLDNQTAIEVVGQHRGSIGIELGKIQQFAAPSARPPIMVSELPEVGLAGTADLG